MTLHRLPILLIAFTGIASGQSNSYNTGSLGAAADGQHRNGVLLDQPGSLVAFGDFSATYSGSSHSVVPFFTEVNPPASSPFTIEFWAYPTNSDGDDAPVNNRIGSGDRAGWVFFQRAPGSGWNFRMYDGVGSNLGWDITGGTSTLNAWSHVVVTWSGSAARLYVNGTLASATNNVPSGGYRVNNVNQFSIGALADGASPFTGSVDEIAFYPTALTPARILEHFQTASSTTPGAYQAMVLADGALLHFQQNPPFAKIAKQGANQVITFTGILTRSSTLAEESWEDLDVASPYLVPITPAEPKLFFRARR